MNRLLALSLVALAGCRGGERDRAAHHEVQARIEAIETRLVPSVIIRGEPIETATLVERMEYHSVPGVSIAVINDRAVEWARAYGMANVDEGRPVTPRTLFQAASISKPVAAMAALKFVEEGIVDLDADVNTYLTSWKVPENRHTAVRPVTLRELLTHTAGMTVHGFPGYPRNERLLRLSEVLAGKGNTEEVRVDAEPGSGWRYSGGGYTVMQMMLTDLTGKPFPQIMRETVLAPIGMSESTYEQPLPEARWAQAASGYRSDGSKVEGDWHVYPEMAAAGLWSTPSDLARFIIEIQKARAGGSHAVLSRATVDEMLTPGMNGWGLGPALQGNGRRFGHAGANEGFRSGFTAFIDTGQGAVVMTNSEGGDALVQEIIFNIAQVYGWPGFEPTEKAVAELATAVLESSFTSGGEP